MRSKQRVEKEHLGSSCRKCGKKVRFKVREGRYTKCGCVKAKDTQFSYSREQVKKIRDATRHMERFKNIG